MKVTVPGTEKYSGLASGGGSSSLGFWMPCSVARLVPPPLPLSAAEQHSYNDIGPQLFMRL
jgi:hypothetical protein